MATVFSGGTYVNTTIDGSSKTSIITDMQTQLTAAGWSVVSGSGTTNLLMESAQDPTTGNRGRVRFKDNAGSCVQVTIENHAGSQAQAQNTTTGGNLLPGTAKTFRVLASKYRFEVFTPGSSVARQFVAAGILWIPAPYQGIITEAIYLQGNAASDSDATTRASWRNVPYSQGENNAGICNGSMYQHNNDGNNAYEGDVQIRVPCNGFLAGYWSGANSGLAGPQTMCRWHDQAVDMADVLMGWGLTNISDEPLIRGQPYDWTWIADSFVADLTDSWSDGGASHNWYALTVSNVGTAGVASRGTIWVSTS